MMSPDLMELIFGDEMVLLGVDVVGGAGGVRSTLVVVDGYHFLHVFYGVALLIQIGH